MQGWARKGIGLIHCLEFENKLIALSVFSLFHSFHSLADFEFNPKFFAVVIEA